MLTQGGLMAGLNLMDVLTQANDGQGVSQLAKQFGMEPSQAQSAISALLPALSSGLKRNVSQPGGLAALMAALQQGDHDKYLDNPNMLSNPETVSDGNAILGHLLGSKDVSRAAAARASEKTGLPDSLLKQLLPVIATMAMGALSKQKKDSGIADILSGALSGTAAQSGGGLGGMLGGLLGGGKKPAANGGMPDLGMLGSLLDADKDGTSMDDIFDMLSKR